MKPEQNRVCEETTCDQDAIACCDFCDHHFCEDHGNAGAVKCRMWEWWPTRRFAALVGWRPSDDQI